jgi:hypothetical protein
MEKTGSRGAETGEGDKTGQVRIRMNRQMTILSRSPISDLPRFSGLGSHRLAAACYQTVLAWNRPTEPRDVQKSLRTGKCVYCLFINNRTCSVFSSQPHVGGIQGCTHAVSSIPVLSYQLGPPYTPCLSFLSGPPSGCVGTVCITRPKLRVVEVLDWDFRQPFPLCPYVRISKWPRKARYNC